MVQIHGGFETLLHFVPTFLRGVGILQGFIRATCIEERLGPERRQRVSYDSISEFIDLFN